LEFTRIDWPGSSQQPNRSRGNLSHTKRFWQYSSAAKGCKSEGSASADFRAEPESATFSFDREMGRNGGKKGGQKGARMRAEALTPEQRSPIARKAAKTRWAKAKKQR
jgi:hypothetical protein